MRIGIDGRFIRPDGAGLGRYAERLITYLERLESPHEFVVFIRPGCPWRPSKPHWRTVMADVRWYTLAEQLRMPAVFLRERLDLLHALHFNFPILYPKKFVVTLHDLILDDFPTARASTLEPIVFRAKLAAYNVTLSQTVNRASRIMTVSQWSSQRVTNIFPKAANKLTVTYEAADPLPPASPTEILASHGITQPYILYVGNAYPHKNLERFLAASQAAAASGEQFQTVIVGKDDFFSRRLKALSLERHYSNIVFYGYASDAEYHRLLQNARAYFFPSQSEGFGLPGLEAMLAGTPVFAARASCLPEIYVAAAHYFDPTSEPDMVRAIRVGLHDDRERQRLIAAGRQRVRDFSWGRMARQTLNVYDTALGHG